MKATQLFMITVGFGVVILTCRRFQGPRGWLMAAWHSKNVG